MSRFLDPSLRRLEAYVPGEQPQDKTYVKLNTNESPDPPSPEVIAAVSGQEVADLRLYSDPECRLLAQALADHYGVSCENVLFGNGSDECLNFFFLAFCKSTPTVFPDITYGFYKVFGDLHGVDYTEIPLTSDFRIDVADYCGIGKNVVLANPNAPTGIALPLRDIERIVASNPDNAVLIDEAYVDFGGESAVSLTKKYDNLLVVGTFSKSRSLAGARLGFAIGNKDMIADLHTVRYSTNPYNVNRLTLVAGRAALASQSYFDENCKKIVETRAYTKAALEKLGFTVLPSETNFLFAKSDRISGEELYLRLKERGVLVRHFTKERIRDFNRITVGTKEQCETLIKTIQDSLA